MINPKQDIEVIETLEKFNQEKAEEGSECEIDKVKILIKLNVENQPVPLFNDRLEKEIDDWLHVMKYDKVPFTYSPYMAQVADKLSILKMTEEERASSYYQKKLHTDRDELHDAEARSKEQGIKEGGVKITIFF